MKEEKKSGGNDKDRLMVSLIADSFVLPVRGNANKYYKITPEAIRTSIIAKANEIGISKESASFIADELTSDLVRSIKESYNGSSFEMDYNKKMSELNEIILEGPMATNYLEAMAEKGRLGKANWMRKTDDSKDIADR